MWVGVNDSILMCIIVHSYKMYMLRPALAVVGAETVGLSLTLWAGKCNSIAGKQPCDKRSSPPIANYADVDILWQWWHLSSWQKYIRDKFSCVFQPGTALNKMVHPTYKLGVSIAVNAPLVNVVERMSARNVGTTAHMSSFTSRPTIEDCLCLPAT